MKKLIALLLALVMVIGLVACGNSKAPAADAPAADAPAADAPAADAPAADAPAADPAEIPTLSLLMFTEWYKSGWEALVAYIDENAEELGFRIEIEQIAGGAEGEQLLQAKFATGDLPDLLQSYGAKWLDYNADVLSQMVPLENVDMSDYDEAVLSQGGYVWNGTLYGVPVDSASLVTVVYNKEVFAAAGVTEVPSNWDEFLTACEKINATGVTPVYLSGADAWTLGCACHFGFNEDVAASGLSQSEFWNEMNTNKRHYADMAYAKDNMKKIKGLIDSGYVNESFLSDTYDMAQTAIGEGTAAMYANGTWVYDEIAAKYPEQADNIGCFALPLYEKNYMCSSLPGAIGMTEACENKELGMKVLNFLASAEAQQVYASAQPGIYLNKAVTCELSECYQTAVDAMNNGGSMALWQNVNRYHYGDWASCLQDYFAGSMTEDEVLAFCDTETANNAIAAGDSNWN